MNAHDLMVLTAWYWAPDELYDAVDSALLDYMPWEQRYPLRTFTAEAWSYNS